jgi:pimeloyl-ACP methyl ester carboxylesterase
LEATQARGKVFDMNHMFQLLTGRRGLARRSRAVLFVAVISVLAACTIAQAGEPESQLGWRDELVYRLLGSPLATIELEMLRPAEGPSRFTSRNHYTAQATEVVAEWEFDGHTAPISFRHYSFSVTAPGVKLDAAIAWDDEVTFEVVQTGTKGVFSPPPADPQTAIGAGSNLIVVPLDNNALADYIVATWLLPSVEPGERGDFGMAFPVSLTQHSMVVKATVEYLGLDDSLGREALKHRVSVAGTAALIWSTRDERRLVKFQVPSQGVEIVNEALLAEWSAVGEEPAGADELGAGESDAGTSVGEVPEAKFDEREVQVPARGGSLAATLSIPVDAAGKVPGVVVVAGSGPTDRDGNNPLIPGEVNTYKEIAHYLASRGVAVLRYDKRGIAASAGLASSGTPPFSWYAEDAASCLEFLRSVEGVDADRVFFAGHSEGGVLALVAATSGSDIAGLIFMSSPGYPMHHTLRLQMEAQGDAAESMGLAGMKEKILTALDDLYEAIRTGKPFDYSIYGLPQELAPVYLSLDLQREFVEGMLFADPGEMARRVDVPVCIIQGTADTQVGVENALALADAVGDGVETHIIEGVDHVLKPTEGEPLPYGDPSRRVSPEVLTTILGFVTP